MRTPAFRRKSRRIIFLLLSLVCAARLAAAEPPVKNVLVLFPYAPDYPAWDRYMEGVKQGFATDSEFTIRYTYEFLDMELAYTDPGYLWKTAEYYRYKYGIRRPDVVVTSSMLESFIDGYSDVAFRGVPIVMSSNEATPTGAAGNDSLYAVEAPFDFAKTVNLALTLRPDTKRLYLVLGTTEQEVAAAGELRRLEPSWAGRAEFTYLNDLSHADILARVADAESDSAVILFWLFKDAAGAEFRSAAVAGELARVSPVPVYGIEEQYLGTGIAGGYLWSMTNYGRNAAICALEILHAPAYRIPRYRRIDVGGYGIDWNALKRWSINPSLIPAESVVINHRHNFLEVYGVYVLLFALLALGNIGFASAFVLYRASKIQIERELEVMSLRLSLALKEGAELNRRLDSRALRDPLTGLFTRKHADDRIVDEYDRYRKTGAEFSLIQVDVDSFTTVNERFGRETGNILLSRIAGELIKLVRLYDLLARWSGEEFMILLPDTDEDTAAAFAERIRKAVSGAVYFEKEHKLVVTISCGVAASRDAATVADLIRHAENALGDAQSRGRNRVVRHTAVKGT